MVALKIQPSSPHKKRSSVVSPSKRNRNLSLSGSPSHLFSKAIQLEIQDLKKFNEKGFSKYMVGGLVNKRRSNFKVENQKIQSKKFNQKLNSINYGLETNESLNFKSHEETNTKEPIIKQSIYRLTSSTTSLEQLNASKSPIKASRIQVKKGNIRCKKAVVKASNRNSFDWKQFFKEDSYHSHGKGVLNDKQRQNSLFRGIVSGKKVFNQRLPRIITLKVSQKQYRKFRNDIYPQNLIIQEISHRTRKSRSVVLDMEGMVRL